MIKTIAIVLVVLVAAILGYAAIQPDSFRVERATTIKATPETIYAYIEDFHRWDAWSPWEKLDPAMKKTFSGAGAGKGAVYAWQGDDKVGEGRMEIVESTPSSKVVIKLDFIKPFEGHDITEFTLDSKDDGTSLSWVMSGSVPYFAKVMGIFTSMDSMIGKDFEKGLANLKAAAEK